MQTIEKQPPNMVTSPSKQNRFTCICCRIKFDTAELQRAHFKTEWHCYNLKRRVCMLEPIDLNEFNQIQANVAINDGSGDRASNFDTSSFVDLGAGDSESSSSNDIDDDWETIGDSAERLDEDYDDAEIDAVIAKMIKSDNCLFCDKKSPTTTENVEHMSSNHGFFIPEERYLIDQEGLMEYLGFKVGASMTCLWCDKHFDSLHGVRLHMLYKNHCKIYYDQEKAVGEFKDFYDYSSQEQIPMKPLNELDIPRRRADRYHEYNRSVELTKPCSKVLSPAERTALAKQEKVIKRFNYRKAHHFLRVGLAHNKSARGRLRNQNPI